MLILQLGAVTCTILFARVNGLIAALIGAFSFNFLFTEPFYSVRMTEFDDVINIATFLVVAILTSEFTAFYKRQQTALRKAQLQANVLRSVSHDLRTPLSTIIGSMETLDTYYYSLPEDDKRELIRGAIVESRRLHSYIENILQATKIQNDLLIAGREEVSVKLLIENVLIRFSNPRIVTSYSGHVRQIYASGPLLEQAIFNVIDNALKFSEQDVLVKVVSDSKSTTIAVEDSGIGLKDGDTERPFMLFSSSRDGDVGTGGIGLGLNVARGIAEAHKGKLVLESLTPGCRAIISIPNLSAKSS
ncbi:sensor histidine kinase [Alteromonas sp. KUL17]|nr:sensor histidine kinase [Alteromonas sp. KUL17]